MGENGRMRLSEVGQTRLYRAMSELQMNDRRPEVLRIALAKGLAECEEVPEKPGGKVGWEIPHGVVARGDEYLLFKHLIITRLQRPIDDDEVDDFMLRYIEKGLEIMEQEIDSLSDLDNYVLYLVSKHQR
jgi:hypothetical protein